MSLTGDYQNDFIRLDSDIEKVTKSLYVEEFTLSSDITSTVIDNDRCANGSFISIMPLTANAKDIQYYIVAEQKKFTVHHDSNANSDLKFRYIIVNN